MGRRSALTVIAAGVGLAATALVVIAPVAAAAGLPAPILAQVVVKPGEPFTVSGSGCLPRNPPNPETVAVSGPGYAETTTAPDGTWSVTMIESITYAGTYPITTTCLHGPAGQEDYPVITITVDGPVAPYLRCTPVPALGKTCPSTPPGPSPSPSQTPSTAPPSTAVPRVNGPPTSTARTSTSPTPDPSSTAPSGVPTASAAGESTAAAATGCLDCARLTGGAPVTAGARLVLSYIGFQPGERVAVVVHSTPVDLGAFTADASGLVTASVRIPAGLEAGTHTLTLTGAVTGERLVRFRLAAPAPRASALPESPVPASAAGWGPLGWSAVSGAGLLLVATGAFILRRRRSADAATRPVPQDRPASGIG